MSNPSTGRSRQILTGRSNISEGSYRDNYQNAPIPKSGRSLRSSAESSLASSVKRRLNDPLEVFHPFSPEVKSEHCSRWNPPILPKHPDPTVPEFEPPKERKGRNNLSCPKEYIKNLQKRTLLEEAVFSNQIDDNTKHEICSEFIERNKDRLWKFSHDYQNKTPRTIYRNIMSDDNFVAKMTYNISQENVLKLKDSDKTAKVLNNPLPSRGLVTDPFLYSLNTSRDERRQKVEKLLAPAMKQHGTEHFRGFQHAPEYGNFSRFNGDLKRNGVI